MGCDWFVKVEARGYIELAFEVFLKLLPLVLVATNEGWR